MNKPGVAWFGPLVFYGGLGVLAMLATAPDLGLPMAVGAGLLAIGLMWAYGVIATANEPRSGPPRKRQ